MKRDDERTDRYQCRGGTRVEWRYDDGQYSRKREGDECGRVTPYAGTLNGLAAEFVCDDDNDYIYNTEYWSADETPLATVESSNGINMGSPAYAADFGGKVGNGGTHVSTTLYEESAWLVWQLGSNTNVNTAIQNAIWDIMDQATGVSHSSNVTETGYWYWAAQGMSPSAAQTAATYVLTPIAGSQVYPGHSQPGVPQEFLYITPEPDTYAVLGSGLILLSLATFRRGRKKKN